MAFLRNLAKEAFPAMEIIRLLAEKPFIMNNLKTNGSSFIDDKMPIYTYPQKLNLGTAKTLQIYQKTHNIPSNLALIHSITHIEYNAMKAYIDTIARFFPQVSNELQADFLSDFLDIAAQESTHFLSLQSLLSSKGYEYGFMPGIDTIRLEIEKTKDNLIERIAVLALIQEGKGLDAGPHLLKRLKDQEELKVFGKIVEEEVFHVKNGVKWFKIFVGEEKIKEKFAVIWQKFAGNSKKIENMNWKSRTQAGFERSWFEE